MRPTYLNPCTILTISALDYSVSISMVKFEKLNEEIAQAQSEQNN